MTDTLPASCEAALPALVESWSRFLGSELVVERPAWEWPECGQPANAVWEYRCSCGHARRRATCGEHAPEPGAVGCRDCWEAGHECPMTFTAGG